MSARPADVPRKAPDVERGGYARMPRPSWQRRRRRGPRQEGAIDGFGEEDAGRGMRTRRRGRREPRDEDVRGGTMRRLRITMPPPAPAEPRPAFHAPFHAHLPGPSCFTHYARSGFLRARRRSSSHLTRTSRSCRRCMRARNRRERPGPRRPAATGAGRAAATPAQRPPTSALSAANAHRARARAGRRPKAPGHNEVAHDEEDAHAEAATTMAPSAALKAIPIRDGDAGHARPAVEGRQRSGRAT